MHKFQIFLFIALFSTLPNANAQNSNDQIRVTEVREGYCKSNELGKTAIYKEVEYCVKGCSEKNFKACAKPAILNFIQKLEEKHLEVCTVSRERTNEIYDNCLIDKLSKDVNKLLIRPIKNSCKRISCKPSFFERLRY